MANAAALNVVVVANTTQATAALARLQGQLVTTTKVANATTTSLGAKFATASKYAASAAGGALVYGLYKGVKAGIDFEKQMDAVAAVSDSSRKEMKKLEKQALQLGQSTTFSANEVAGAQEELVKGGLRVSDILGGALKASLSLAAAGNLDLATASETTVNAMKLFGLEGKNAGQVADALATAANKTTADVEDFAMALKQGGSVARIAGLDFNETVTILEALAEAGIKNSDAGTSMKAFFLNLATPSTQAKDAMEQLNVQLYDQAGNLKPLPALSENLRQAFGDLTKEQFLNKAGVIAGSDAVRTLYALYDAGPGKLAKLQRANAEEGTAQAAAKKRMDNTAGSLEELSGAFETLSIKMFQSAQSPIRGFIDTLTDKLKAFTAIVTSDKLTSSEKISGVIDLISDTIKEAAPVLIGAGAKLGAAIIKGIGQAFIEGDMLTRLFIGGAVFKMFGGIGLLRSAGSRVMTAMFGGLGGLLGGKLGSLGGTLAGPGMTPARPLFVSVVNRLPGGTTPTTTGGKTSGGGSRGGSSILPFAGAATVLGIGAFRKQLIDQIFPKGWANEGMHRAFDSDSARTDLFPDLGARFEQIKKTWEGIFDGSDPVDAIEARKQDLFDTLSAFKAQFGSLKEAAVAMGSGTRKSIFGVITDLREAGAIGDKQFERLTGIFGSFDKSSGRDMKHVGQSMRQSAGDFKLFATDGGRFLDKMERQFEAFENTVDKVKDRVGTDLGRAGDFVKDLAGDVDKHTDRAGKSFDKLGDKSKTLKDRVGDNILGAASVVTHGLDVIIGNTNKALHGFGVKRVAISLAGVGGAAAGFGNGKQRGGHINDGAPSGDSVPAMLEKHEYVLNRRAVAKVGKENLDRLNFGAAPRFGGYQKGGKVGGSMASMLSLANKYEQAGYPYSWGGGHGGFPNGTQPVDCSGFVSDILHAGGLLEGAPMVSGSLMSWGKQASGNEPLVVYANPVHTVMSLNGKVAGTSGSNPGGGAGWIEGGNGASLAPGAKRTMDVIGAVASQIKRLLVKGPDGPLKDIAQGSLDKVRAAANRFIESKMPTGTAGGADIGDLPKALQKYNKQYPEAPAPSHLSAPKMPFDAVAALGEWAGMPGVSMAKTAIGESALAPGASGIDPGGTKGLGLWMITTGFNDALIAQYGGQKSMFNPILNAQAADSIFDSQGIGAWYSATKDSSNTHYSGPLLKQRGGVVGMQEGGIVGAARPSPWGDIPDFGDDSGGGGGRDEGGGIISLTKAIRKILATGPTKGKAAEKYDDKRHDSDVVKKVRDHLRKLVTGKNYPTTADGELAGKIGETRTDADKYAEFADIAGRMEAPYHGKDQVGWMHEQLVALLNLRNQLIGAEKEMEKEARRVRKLERDANRRLREFERKTRVGERLLGKAGKTPGDWDSKDEDPATTDVAKWNKLEDKKRKALMHKFLRKDGRLPGDRLFAEDAALLTPEKQPGAFPNVAGWKQVAGFLKNTVIGTLKGSDGIEGTMDSTMATLKDELKNVAGTGSGMEKLKPADFIDKIGRFGGEIFDTQMAIKEIQATEGPQPLDISGLRSVIEATRYGVFDNTMPRFHSGGVVPGRAGQDVPIMAQAGERVTAAGAETFVGYAYVDLGEGVSQRVKLEFDKRDRGTHTMGRQYR